MMQTWIVTLISGAAAVGVAYAAGHQVGALREREKWAKASTEQLASLNDAVSEAMQSASRAQSELERSQEARDALLERLQDAEMGSDGNAVCLDADGVRDLESALETLRTSGGAGPSPGDG